MSTIFEKYRKKPYYIHYYVPCKSKLAGLKFMICRRFFHSYPFLGRMNIGLTALLRHTEDAARFVRLPRNGADDNMKQNVKLVY